jgi:hypothetical protein
MRADRRRLLAGTGLAGLALAAGLPGCALSAGRAPRPRAGEVCDVGRRVPQPRRRPRSAVLQTPDVIADAARSPVPAGDVLLDLGSVTGGWSSGRPPVSSPGLGVEIDPRLVELSRDRAPSRRVSALARWTRICPKPT